MTERPVPGVPDAVIRQPAEVPGSLPGAARVGGCSVARPGALLRIDPGVGRFLVRGGKSIDVAPEPGAHSSDIDAFLYGPVLAALILQRGEVPLHAATLVPPGGGDAVAFVGSSGSGKSTLAYALVARGWSLLSDDLTRVDVVDGQPRAWPGRDVIKLWDDSCRTFDLSVTTLERTPDARPRYLVPVRAAGDLVDLGTIVCLERGNHDGVTTLDAAGALPLVIRNIHCLRYMRALGQAAGQLRVAAAIISRARFCRVGGATDAADLAELVTTLMYNRVRSSLWRAKSRG